MPSHTPAYIPAAAVSVALLTAWCAATILWQIHLERQAQCGERTHPLVRRRLRLARARRLIPTRPARSPQRAAPLRRKVTSRR